MPKCLIMVDSDGIISPFFGGEHELAALPRTGEYVAAKKDDEATTKWHPVKAVIHRVDEKSALPVVIVDRAPAKQKPSFWGMNEF